MTARFWWRLRRWWHLPNMWQECVWPQWHNQFSALMGWDDRDGLSFRDWVTYTWWIYRKAPRFIWEDIKITFVRLGRLLAIVQPFHCNGNAGGWRTTVCEWLEFKARSLEEEA